MALAWGRHVSLLDVPLVPPHEEPGAGALISFQYRGNRKSQRGGCGMFLCILMP